MDNIKRCKYRNCCKVIEGRKDKKFCCLNHRKMEHVYLKREDVRFKNEKNDIRKILIDFENGCKETIDLYKKIFG
jgi:hypothetical protein